MFIVFVCVLARHTFCLVNSSIACVSRADPVGDARLRRGLNSVQYRSLAAPAGPFAAVTVGQRQSCAIAMPSSVRSAGDIVCFGVNEYGVSMGLSHALTAGSFGSVSCGAYTTCTVTDAGVASCVGSWGNDLRSVDAGVYLPSSAAATGGLGGSTGFCFIVAATGALYCKGLTIPGTPPVLSAVSTFEYYGCGILLADSAVTCWGQNQVGEAIAPGGGTFKSISTGYRVACGVQSDDSLFCWGSNTLGQGPTSYGPLVLAVACSSTSTTCVIKLSDGALACFGASTTSLSVPPTTGAYKALAIGYGGQACAVRTDGTLNCWGVDTQLSTVPPASGGFTAVSCGKAHCCALAPDRVTCWGSNDRGQLGNFVAAVPCAYGSAGPSCANCSLGSAAVLGALQCTPCPPGTYGALDDAGAAVCAGCAPGTGTTAAGSTSCGACAAGQAGTGGSPCAPCAANTYTSGGGASVCATCATGTTSGAGATSCSACGAGGCVRAVRETPLDTADGFACWLVASTGGVACAGYSQNAQLNVPKNLTNSPRCVSVCSGQTFACALRSDGSTVCWGALPAGKPAFALVSIACGVSHVCGLDAGGFASCWGSNSYGEHFVAFSGAPYAALALTDYGTCALTLDGSILCGGFDRSGVMTKAPTASGFVGFDVGFNSACAYDAAGVLTCWGEGNYGQLSPPAGARVASVTMGYYHGCGLETGTGRAICWGYCNTDNRCAMPEGDTYAHLSAGWYETCGVTTAGAVRCVGTRFAPPSLAAAPATALPPAVAVSAGELFTCVASVAASGVTCSGSGAVGEYSSVFPSTSDAFVQLASGGLHTCGLLQDGSVRCFGDNSQQQCSPPTLSPAVAVMVNLYTSCVLRVDLSLVCWGQNVGANLPAGYRWAQVALGGQHATALSADDGTISVFTANSMPSLAAAPAGTFVAVGSSQFTSCAIAVGPGAVTCWGTSADLEMDVPAGLLLATVVGHARSIHYCGLRVGSDGVACWGNNLWGQVSVPTAARSGAWLSVVVGGWHSCALKSVGGTLLCWGRNDFGQVLPWSLAAPTACAGGRAGRVADGCSVCPAGKFAPAYSTDCVPCPRGTYGGASGASLCTACPPGTYGNTTGATTRAGGCPLCSPGSFGVAAGAASCPACPALTYSAAAGAVACTVCATGTGSAAGATGCAACGVGSLCASSVSGRGGSVAGGWGALCWLTPAGVAECFGHAVGSAGTLVPDATARYVQLCVSTDFACGILAGSHAVVCWGPNIPVPIPAGAFASTSCGYLHVCGIRLDGSSVCW